MNAAIDRTARLAKDRVRHLALYAHGCGLTRNFRWPD